MIEIEVPSHFFEVKYDGSRLPGVAVGLSSGANCQHFCYELLRHFGFEIGELRSSDLWEDVTFTETVKTPIIFDLVLFNRTSNPYGAHVGICIGENEFLHLSKRNTRPVTWPLSEFMKLDEYTMLIGFKRPIKKIAGLY